MLREILTAVALSAGGFLFVMVAGNLLRGPLGDALGGRMPWGVFFEVMLLYIPSMLPYVLPIATVAGVMIVLGRMSAQNEITAMKASGMSLPRIAAPIVAIGLAGTLFAVLVNFEYAPRADSWRKLIVTSAVRTNPENVLVEKTPVTEFPGYIIYADKREGTVMRGVWIWRREKLADNKYGRDVELIRAARAELSTEPGRTENAGDVLHIRLSDAVIEHRTPGGKDEPESVSIGGSRRNEPPGPRRENFRRRLRSFEGASVEYLSRVDGTA